MLVNAKIEQAGLYYDGHYDRYCIRIEFETSGGGASIQMSVDKTQELMSMFGDELDLENGVFVNELKGIPVVLKLDGDDRYKSRIVAIGNILASENEMLYLDCPER